MWLIYDLMGITVINICVWSDTIAFCNTILQNAMVILTFSNNYR